MKAAALGCTLGIALTLACSSGGRSGDSAGDGAVEAPPPLESCLMIRNCTYLCGADAVCAQGCLDRAKPDARALYDQLTACSIAACPTGDVDCRCANECSADGACLAQVDACTEALQEGFCVMCH